MWAPQAGSLSTPCSSQWHCIISLAVSVEPGPWSGIFAFISACLHAWVCTGIWPRLGRRRGCFCAWLFCQHGAGTDTNLHRSRLNCLDLQASTFHLHFQCVRLILQVSVGNFQLHGMQPKQLGGFHRLALAVSLEGNCTVFESTSGA